RLAVLELDTWRRSLRSGRERPVAHVVGRRPWPGLLFVGKESSDLLEGASFTPEAYLKEIERLGRIYFQQRDVLMYYGGMPPHPARNGLNFNGWSAGDLRRLREKGSRPFIGLETFDLTAIRLMAERLKKAGYRPTDRVYVRIGSEPSYEAYGTDSGTPQGRRHTARSY